jgi:hypothetical protein
MWQFFQYLGALMKHLKGVVASIVGSILVASPSWIRAALSPEWQHRLDVALTFNVDSVRKAYLLFIPIGLFWTTYKAWQEENSAKVDALKSTPEGLRRELAALRERLTEIQSAQGRTITRTQRDAFKNAADLVDKNAVNEPRMWGAMFIVSRIDPECEDYARRLVDLFAINGTRATFSGPSNMEVPTASSQGIGLLQVVADPSNLPDYARVLCNLIRAAHIECEIVRDPRGEKMPLGPDSWYFLILPMDIY